MSDELNPYASEFFQVTNWVDKRSEKVRKQLIAQAAKQVAAPVIEQAPLPAPTQVAVPVVEQAPEAVAEIKIPEPINFWTAPIKYKKETVATTLLDMQPAAQPAVAAVPGSSCDQSVWCAPPADDKVARLTFKTFAPLGWAALVFVCSATIISQLVVFGGKNCDQAQRLCDSGNYQEALTSASLAVRCNPLSARSYYERGRALVHMLRYREAEECFNQSLNLDPDRLATLDARAALSLKIDKPEQTISDSLRLKALAVHGLNALQYGNMAVACYKIGRYDEAIKFYNQALARGGNKLSICLGQTYCLSGKQQHKQALAACDGLINQHGAQSQILALRGYCLQRLHDLAGAQKDFDLALAKEPTNPTYYGYRGALMAQLKKPVAALADYTKAANLDRRSAPAQYVVAKMLKTLGRDKEALTYYDRLAQLPSFEYSFGQHQERAALNFSAGNYEACLADLKRAIELKPDCDAHVTAAVCLAHLGQDSKARVAIAEAYRLRPESAGVMLGEAQVDALLGQSLSAVDKYSKVLTAKGDNKAALIGRGQCYFGRGQWASAAEDLKRAVAMGVSDVAVTSNLAQCQSVLNKGAKISLDLPTQKIVDLSKLDRVGLSDKGRAAYQGGDMQLAVIYFAELAKREPANMDARKNLAHSLEAKGDHGDAIAVFEPLSQGGRLEVKDQNCYAHALAAAGLYERSIAIMQRLHNGDPANMTYRLELTKMFSAAGQIDKALGMCRDSLAMHGSIDELKSLNNVYESLVTERLRSKKDNDGSIRATSATRAETEG
jgi:tetratricopeptide (TPR) repeat protein